MSAPARTLADTFAGIAWPSVPMVVHDHETRLAHASIRTAEETR